MGILDRIAGTLEELTGEADDPNAEIARAEELAARGETAEAEAVLVGLTGRSPPPVRAFLALGRLRAGANRLDEAVAVFGRAVDLDSDNPGAWAALGESLVRLGRLEPARDALRRALTLGLDAGLRGRAQAALGRVHALAGQWTAAARAQRKALELLSQDEIDREVALDYGRTLARLGEREATEWLTRAARTPGDNSTWGPSEGPHTPPRRTPLGEAQLRPRASAIFVEAAAATGDDALAEKLLREGLAREPRDLTLREALARRLAGTGRADEAVALAQACVAEAPDDREARRALRETLARAGRWADALRAAADEVRLGAPPSLHDRIALALGAEDTAALATISSGPWEGPEPPAMSSGEQSLPSLTRYATDEIGLVRALEALVQRRAGEPELVLLGRVAPTSSARRFVAREVAPPPPPSGTLPGLLTWTHDLATRSPPLASLAPAAGHAVEALDRPLLVAVMGEFNAGKSSFVNALCGEEVAPTGVLPTTATVNVLRYGATPEARLLRHDGTVRTMRTTDVVRELTQLSDDEVRAVRLVEIFLPVETLRRVEVVDTPGLNSIRPEHERVAREFLQEADAIVWVFAIGQAAKATEKEALSLARGAGKHVVGVLNKVDRAEPSEIAAVVQHVGRSLGDLVETVVPLSATRALEARRAGRADPEFAVLTATLEDRFYSHALELKRATALSSLRRFVAAAEEARRSASASGADFDAARHALDDLRGRLAGALAGERVALRSRIDEAYRRAATEVREFVRPRSWLFGEHRATPADEEFLADLLEDAVTRATDRSRQILLQAMDGPAGETTRPIEQPGYADARAAVVQAIDAAVDRFAAYARGVIEGGAVPDFFRHHLPRLRLDVIAIREALTRRAPDPEEAFFAALRRELEAIFKRSEDDLDTAAIDAETLAFAREARIVAPLEALAKNIGALDNGG